MRLRRLRGDYGGLVKNFSWLGIASLSVKPLWFLFITVACVRVLGVNGYGVMMTAMSLAALLFSFTGFGIEVLSVQRVSPRRSSASLYFSNFLFFRVALCIAAVVASAITAWVLGYTLELLLAVLAASAYYFFLSTTELIRSYFQAFEDLKRQALTVVVEKVIVVAAGAMALYLVARAGTTLLAMALGMAATSIYAYRLLQSTKTKFDVRLINKKFLRVGGASAVPFGIAGILGMFYFRIDTVMVEGIAGTVAAGRYGFAFRLVEALNMLPLLVVQATLYPRLSVLVREKRYSDLRWISLIAGFVLICASVPIAYLLWGFAAPVINLLTGSPDMAGSIDVLRVLAWVFPLTSIRLLLYYILIANGAQRLVAVLLSVGLVVNVLLNAILIPTVGIVGAAIATVVSECVLIGVYGVALTRSRAQLRTVPS